MKRQILQILLALSIVFLFFGISSGQTTNKKWSAWKPFIRASGAKIDYAYRRVDSTADVIEVKFRNTGKCCGSFQFQIIGKLKGKTVKGSVVGTFVSSGTEMDENGSLWNADTFVTVKLIKLETFCGC